MSYKISRRSFLKVSAMTAAAVAVAGATTGCSIAPFETQCTKNGNNEMKFGDFTIAHFSTDCKDSSTITVCFAIDNKSDSDLTIYASDFRASCEANGLGEVKAKGVSFDISETTKAVLKAKSTGFLNVDFEGVKGKNDFPITVKLHRGMYSLKYLIAGEGAALVTPQPYFELVW